MKKNLESIKDLKFQALEKTQMMKILGGDCKTDGRTVHGMKSSADKTDSSGVTTHYSGSDDLDKVKDLVCDN